MKKSFSKILSKPKPQESKVVEPEDNIPDELPKVEELAQKPNQNEEIIANLTKMPAVDFRKFRLLKGTVAVVVDPKVAGQLIKLSPQSVQTLLVNGNSLDIIDENDKKSITNNHLQTQDERAYLSLLQALITNGVRTPNRTGVSANVLFAETLRFTLADGTFPLLTSRILPFRHIVEELLWFLSGSTNTKDLSAKGIRIWDGNSSREFLDKRGLGYPEGFIGSAYGHQWRRFGAPYTDNNGNIIDYASAPADSTKFPDQIADLIKSLQNDPFGRRHVLSAWNPGQTHEMALPPCHLMAIFVVTPNIVQPPIDEEDDEDLIYDYKKIKKVLNCHLTMRSADVFHGVPWNIACYSLLTHILAENLDMLPGELVITMANAHLYTEHLSAAETLIKREFKKFPTIKIKAKKTNIWEYKFDDFVLENYNPGPAIKVPMVV